MSSVHYKVKCAILKAKLEYEKQCAETAKLAERAVMVVAAREAKGKTKH